VTELADVTTTAAGRVEMVHTELVAAPARDVYELVADVTAWPHTFGPTVHVEVLESTPAWEHLRIWAFAHGTVRTWTSHRTLDPEALTVDFRQGRPAAPVRTMGGQWRLLPQDDGRTLVELRHDFTAADAEAIDLIRRAVDVNSTAELAALREAAEQGASRADLVLEFADSVEIDGAADDVAGFLRDAALWPARLPHVARLDVAEDEPGVQVMSMDTRSTDGSLHTTESVRVCLPDGGIVYKQTATPAVMAAHIGRWSITEVPARPGRVVATSAHTVVLRPDEVAALLGTRDLARARAMVRHALGTNSRTTLAHAKAFAEGRATTGRAAA
jgi:aromatase